MFRRQAGIYLQSTLKQQYLYYCMLSSVVVNKLLINEERVICAKVGLNAASGYKLAFTSS